MVDYPLSFEVSLERHTSTEDALMRQRDKNIFMLYDPVKEKIDTIGKHLEKLTAAYPIRLLRLASAEFNTQLVMEVALDKMAAEIRQVSGDQWARYAESYKEGRRPAAKTRRHEGEKSVWLDAVSRDAIETIVQYAEASGAAIPNLRRDSVPNQKFAILAAILYTADTISEQ